MDSKPVLKPNHLNGYYSQIQLAMGLSGIENCDFTVYTFKGMIIIRTKFDSSYFKSLLDKLTKFYKDFMLPSLTYYIYIYKEREREREREREKEREQESEKVFKNMNHSYNDDC